jgi:fluoroquinolone resistance protein
MADIYLTDETFNKIDYTTDPPARGVYENCTFKGCSFARVDLSRFQFIDCRFDGCDLSLANLNQATLRDVTFRDCKMLGLRFDTCNEFGLSLSFDGCRLDHSSFFKVKIRKTVFKNSQLQETDFAESDLTGSVFDNCDLAKALFDHCLLEKVDFRTAYHYSIDPETNRIKKARFSLPGISGLLDKYAIEIE